MKTLLLSLAVCLPCAAADISAQLTPILAVGPEGRGNAEASAAWQALSKADAAALPEILKAMNGAGELSANWLRGAVSAIVRREAGKLPLEAIKGFAVDVKNSGPARLLAFDLIRRADEGLWNTLVPGLLNDPESALRREPVARLLEKKEDVAALRQALEAARDEDQVSAAADALRDKDEVVDLPKHYGFLMDWHVIGPFDNKGRKGHEAVFPPESNIDLSAAYDGRELKAGERNPVKWAAFSSSQQFGMVDFNKPIGMLKESTAFAYTTFQSAEEREAEIRLGCKNAWKVWLNGELLFARDEYHRGAQIDQYRMPVKLKKGENRILVKCSQNEQTEKWTVEWEFQLRVCDHTGTAILSTDRKPTPAAALKSADKRAE
jgi:hypothetical protein